NEKHLEILRLYIDVYQYLGEYRKSVMYSKRFVALNDSLYGKEIIDNLILTRSAHQASEIQSELELKRALLNESKEKIKVLEKDEELSSLKTTFIVSIGSALLALAIIIMVKMRSDHQKKQEIENLSKQMLEASIESKTQRLTQTTLSLTRKREFAEGLLKKLGEINNLEKKNLSPIKLYVANELQMDESILEMEQYISELSKDFFIKIKIDFPQLNENDIKLCGLIRLNLSIKQISIIKNITPESVKISKNRLSKKMDLPPGTKLYDFLK
ncbi:MAG: hypothetical protein JKY54_06540, partial [Flavobacteriales bacterium]|nr:hypothetical protein [Flavobacteriales bacterium]